MKRNLAQSVGDRMRALIASGPKVRRTRRPSPAGFWSMVDASGGVDACWPWLGARTAGGYGRHGRAAAHRVAWEIVNGPIPADHSVLHSCDRPECVNPGHLRVGTPADNVAEMIERGRAAWQRK